MSVLCLMCNEVARWDGGESRTLVGYLGREPGHNHDDNCVKRAYVCPNGHEHVYSIRRSCSAPNCTWQGKTRCFCHEKAKVDEWP